MLGAPSDTSSNSLSGFQFTTIGKPPSLLGRISSNADGSQELVSSPPSSPLSSPKMTISHGMPTTSHSSWFVNALSTQQEEATLDEIPQTGQSAARTADANSSTTSHHSLPARPSSTVVSKAGQHKPSKVAIAARTSHTSPSLPAQSSSSSSALRHTSSATPDRSPIVPPSSSVALARPSHAASMSLASVDTALPQHDHEADMDDSWRQMIARFEAEVAEIGSIQAEARRVVANFQDAGAHVHARAEGLVEQFRSRHANTERRVARANQRADELERKLHEAHNRITHLGGENEDLRGEMDKLRTELDQLRGERDRLRGERDRLRGELDRLRGELDFEHGELVQVRGELELLRIQAGKDDVRLNDALKSCQEAIRETELARARWAVVQKKLEDQLVAQKRDAAADKETLLAQIEELKRVAEDANRQVAVLVEEKRKLEVQIQIEVAQHKLSEGPQISCSRQVEKIEDKDQTHDSARKPAHYPASHRPQPDGQVPHAGPDPLPGRLSISSPTTILFTSPRPQVSHGPPSAQAPTDGDGDTQWRPKGELLHLAEDGLSQPSISPPHEPLLAVKDEDQDEVKAKIEPFEDMSTGVSFSSHHHPPTREPRREQSLDYAPIRKELTRSPLMRQYAPDPTTLSGSAPPHIEEQSPGSPVVYFGRHSPELAYPSRRSSYEPASPPREPSPVALPEGPWRPPALELPQCQSSTNPQFPTSERRGPVTPPLENAPSAQAKRLIRRPGRPLPGQAMDTAALPARPAQPSIQRSRSPPPRRTSDNWRPSRDHELRSQVRYSDESRDRHKRKRDDDTDTRQPVIRRPRLTPPPAHDHHSPAHDRYPRPQLASRQTSQDLARRTPPRELGDGRSHCQPPPPQEYQYHNALPSDDERTYEPAANGRSRRRVDHYSPPQQQRARYSPDVPTTGYAPEREARAAPIPETEPPYPQMAPSLAERLQGNPDASVHDQPVASTQNKPVTESRLPRTNGGAPPARRQAQRRASRSPSPKRLPPATSSQEPILSASESVPLLERFSDSKTPAPASRGRGSGRGRGNRGRGGQPQQRPPTERPQKSLEERLSMARYHEGGGGLMDRIQPR